MRRHYINTAILWFVLTFVGEILVQNFPLPEAGSREGLVVDDAFLTLLILGLPVFTFALAVLIYSLFNFRAAEDSLEAGATVRGSSTFSLVWLAVTGGLAVTVVIHPGLTGLSQLQPDPSADLVVKISGTRWFWEVEYPDGTTSREELVLPVDRKVRLEVTSNDILHSVWIPAFRLKVDAVPGTTTEMTITPTRTGNFGHDPMLRVQCAELCGAGHDIMMMPVRVVEQSEFDAIF